MANAPTSMPYTEPMPPSTTMHRKRALSIKVKLSGLMKRVLVAKSTPAMPAHTALRAKALSLAQVVFTPITWAAVSSSETAIHERPIREFFSLSSEMNATSIKANVT